MEHLARLLKCVLPRTTPKIATDNSPEPPLSVPRVLPRTTPVIISVNPPEHPALIPRVQTLAAAHLISNVTSIPYTDIASNPTKSKAQHFLPSPVAHHSYNPTTGQCENIDTLPAGPNANIWKQALSNEMGRLAKGVRNRVQFKDTIDFIHRYKFLSDRK